MADAPVQIPFDLRVLQYALAQVISEEDADCLAKIVIRLTDAANAWADPNSLQGEQIALKTLICSEVMRAYRKLAGKGDITSNDHKGDEPSFANICRALRDADSVLADDGAWQDFVKYSPPSFKDDLLQGLETRLALFKELGPYQRGN